MKFGGLKLFVLVSFLWGVVVFSTPHANAVSENTILLYNMAGQGVFNPEAVQMVYHLQLMSISPEQFINNKSNSDFKPSLIRFSGLRSNVLDSFRDLLFGKLQSYETNWFEIEAYNFTSHQKDK